MEDIESRKFGKFLHPNGQWTLASLALDLLNAIIILAQLEYGKGLIKFL